MRRLVQLSFPMVCCTRSALVMEYTPGIPSLNIDVSNEYLTAANCCGVFRAEELIPCRTAPIHTIQRRISIVAIENRRVSGAELLVPRGPAVLARPQPMGGGEFHPSPFSQRTPHIISQCRNMELPNRPHHR